MCEGSCKAEIDVYGFVSKTYFRSLCVFFCHDPLSHLAVNKSSCMRSMHKRTDFLRFGTSLRNEG